MTNLTRQQIRDLSQSLREQAQYWAHEDNRERSEELRTVADLLTENVDALAEAEKT
jgi:acyl-CoA reductase-like NAD-dependent aldehyde dehydrogenase